MIGPAGADRPSDARTETIHATAVAVAGVGVLLRGGSGSGKSDLALRLIDRGAVLVSDDYSCVSAYAGTVLATAPDSIAGKMEVRGLGIVPMPHAASARVALVVALDEAVERLPLPDTTTVAGLALPLIRLNAFEASAPIKVEFALRALAFQAP